MSWRDPRWSKPRMSGEGRQASFVTKSGQPYTAALFQVAPGHHALAFAHTGDVEDPYGTTGTGDAKEVFGHVAKLVHQHLRDDMPQRVTFSAASSEPSRVKLYTSLVRKAKKIHPEYQGFVREKDGSHVFDILRKGQIEKYKAQQPDHVQLARIEDLQKLIYNGGWIHPDGRVLVNKERHRHVDTLKAHGIEPFTSAGIAKGLLHITDDSDTLHITGSKKTLGLQRDLLKDLRATYEAMDPTAGVSVHGVDDLDKPYQLARGYLTDLFPHGGWIAANGDLHGNETDLGHADTALRVGNHPDSQAARRAGWVHIMPVSGTVYASGNSQALAKHHATIKDLARVADSGGGKYQWIRTDKHDAGPLQNSRWEDGDHDRMFWHFETPGGRYSVRVAKPYHPSFPHKLMFSQLIGGDEHVDMTGAGHAKEVMSNVIKAVHALLHEQKPRYVKFTADNREGGRVKLYQWLTDRVHKIHPDYTGSTDDYGDGDTIFTLTHKDHVERPEQLARPVDTANSEQGRERLKLLARLLLEAKLRPESMGNAYAAHPTGLDAGNFAEIKHNGEPDAVDYVGHYFGLLSGQASSDLHTFHEGEGNHTLTVFDSPLPTDQLYEALGPAITSPMVRIIPKDGFNRVAAVNLQDESGILKAANGTNAKRINGQFTTLRHRSSPGSSAGARETHRNAIRRYEESADAG